MKRDILPQTGPSPGKLTIITVCLNAEKTIVRTLESVNTQTYPNIEHILVDGGSSDATLELLRSCSKNEIKLFHQQSKGAYAAMNEAVLHVTGEVICFLNADDAFASEDVCEIAMRALGQKGDAVDAIYGDVMIVNESSKQMRHVSMKNFKPWMFAWGFMPPQPGFFVRNEVMLKVGEFRTDLQIASDFDWVLRFNQCGFRAGWVNGIRVNMLSGGLSTRGIWSTRIIQRELWQILRERHLIFMGVRLWLRYPFKLLGKVRSVFA